MSSPRETLSLRFLSPSELGEEDLERALAVIQSAFGHWPLLDPGVGAADHLRWKLEGGGGDRALLVGLLGSELVIVETLWHWKVLLNGREHRRLSFNDSAVPPHHQGRGFSSQLNRFKDDHPCLGPYLHLAISRQRQLRVQWPRRGMTLMAPRIDVLLRPLQGLRLGLRREGTLSRILALSAPLLVASSLWGRARYRASPARERRFTIESVERFDNGVRGLFDKVAGSFDMVQVRTPEHLTWRYCDRRGGPFNARRALGESGETLGYCVSRPGSPWASLMDLMVEPGRLDIAKALAKDAVALCRGPKVLAMQCWLPRRHPYAGVLRHCGFAYTGRSVGIGCRTSGIPAEDAGCLTRPDARIHWMLGETDFA